MKEARDRARIFPASLTGEVTSEIAEDDWERGSCSRGPFLFSGLQEAGDENGGRGAAIFARLEFTGYLVVSHSSSLIRSI